MLKSVEGEYRDGKIELLEPAPPDVEGRVIVTFLARNATIELAEHGIDDAQAADLRHRLNCFREDWDRPEMDVYDEL